MVMPDRSSNSCPFFAGPAIRESQYFIGRDEELRFMASRMTGDQPISISLVGKHKIGKSSLLYRFFQIWNPDRFPPRPKGSGANNSPRLPRPVKKREPFAVIYLDLQDAECQTEAGFYSVVAAEARDHKVVQQYGQAKLWQNKSFNRQEFGRAVKACREGGVLLVLCLDKFDVLFQNTGEFDNGFYDSLHSFINHSRLMLIVATLKKLEVYRQESQLTSSFFNVSQTIELTEFQEKEAEALVKLPYKAETQNPLAPKLNIQEQKIARKWGKRHPYLLQLAGHCLWDARQMDKDTNWAKAQFDRQIKEGIAPSPPAGNGLERAGGFALDWRDFRRVFLAGILFLPRLFLKTNRFINNTLSEVTGFGAALIVMVALGLAAFQIIDWSQVAEVLKQLLCSTWGGIVQKWCKS